MNRHLGPPAILGLCGSLRARSYNHQALLAAGEALPGGHLVGITTARGIPLYDADEQDEGYPDAVQKLAGQIRAADGVLIASPEYNFSIPGGLKNALDWLSRLPEQPFRAKPVAILGAATGPVGTARMQYDLRRVLQFLDADVLPKPEVFIAHAASRFNAEGRLVDEATRGFVAAQMQAFLAWIGRSRRARGD